MHNFSAKIFKIGINPYVFIPATILKELFKSAGKEKGPIPVRVGLKGQSFIQTLVKYSGHWRLYLNGPMREAANADVGDMVKIRIEFDPESRTIPVHPRLQAALEKNKKAKATFEKLPPSRQKEIIRYIGFLKTEESLDRNVKKAIGFLTGRERFAGTDKP
jgi:hypothetical protein